MILASSSCLDGASLQAGIRIAGCRGVACFRICGSAFVLFEGPDGRVLLRTPRLTGQLACRAAVASLRLITLLDERYRVYRPESGGYAFGVWRPSAGVLAYSPRFPSEDECTRAMETVRRYAPAAYVVQSPLSAVLLEDLAALPSEQPPESASFEPAEPAASSSMHRAKPPADSEPDKGGLSDPG